MKGTWDNMRSKCGTRGEMHVRKNKRWSPCGSLSRLPASPSLARCSSCPSLAPRPRRRRSRRTAGGRRLSCSGWRRGRRRGRRGGVRSPSSSHFPPSLHRFSPPLAARCSVVSHGGCPLQSAPGEEFVKNQCQCQQVVKKSVNSVKKCEPV